MSNWLPPYQIRHSTRAKRMRLRILPGKGLELVLPYGIEEHQATPFLEANRDWITQGLQKINIVQELAKLPKKISLWGASTEYKLVHVTGVSRAAISRYGDTVLLHQKQADTAKALRQLQRWWREEAKAELGTFLLELCTQYGFSVHSIRVKPMRSRWGSCSAVGKISINSYLIFLPASLVRHVLLHELCHTRQMNHSERFWKELFALEADALEQDKLLHRTGWSYVPTWAWV